MKSCTYILFCLFSIDKTHRNVALRGNIKRKLILINHNQTQELQPLVNKIVTSTPKKVWEDISRNLNQFFQSDTFSSTGVSEQLRRLDHIKLILNWKIRQEESPSGIAPEEPTETEDFLENIMYGRTGGRKRRKQQIRIRTKKKRKK